VGLLSSKPKSARPVRSVKPRVYLSKTDRKAINTLRPIERTAAYFIAGYAAIAITIVVGASKLGFTGTNLWRLPLGIAICAAVAVLAWKTNRWLTGIGAILIVYGLPWSAYWLFAFPALGFFAWLNIRLYKDQRVKMDEKAAAGDYGISPRDVPRGRAKAAKEEKATTDASGKPLAPASKRYTPPKVAKKK
jgi:hypothetical protein